MTGDNWLLHGDILNLSVKCQGSPMFSYCINFYKGQYNVTGNETCENPLQNKICEFYVERYFQDPTDHTIVFIISNDVSKVVYPVIVQVYKGNCLKLLLQHIKIFVFSPTASTVVCDYCSCNFYDNSRRFDYFWSGLLCSEQEPVSYFNVFQK